MGVDAALWARRAACCFWPSVGSLKVLSQNGPRGAASCHIRVIALIARADRQAVRLVARRVVWLGFSAATRTGPCFSTPIPSFSCFCRSRWPGILARPLRQSGAGDVARAGVAGVLFGQQLAICRLAARVDRVQLLHRL